MTGIVAWCVDRPKLVTTVMVLATVVLATVAALPSVWPRAAGFLHEVAIDTDPENMLPHDEPVRVFHDAMKEEFALHDMLVVGVMNEREPEGVFNPNSLRRIHELVEYAKSLHSPDPQNAGRSIGVIEIDILAPSTVDSIEPAGVGTVSFEWLMREPPATVEDALEVRRKAARIPTLSGTLISDAHVNERGEIEPPRALALYFPLTSKDISYRVANALRRKTAEFDGDDVFHMTGLPIAEDTFGVEMFKQMAISAPLAMLVIFLLMWFFFRKISLIVSPMIVALVCVIQTMSLLVVSGNTIHIMSSMIPIFIMPIAVLDAVHILSEFFDRYQESKDRRTAIIEVMHTLFMPMLYTSLTTAVGFASLALTPIPPVQVFGLFVAFGVMLAWVLTVCFVPAAVMFIRSESLENFGLTPTNLEQEGHTPMSRFLAAVGRFTYRRAKGIVAVTVVVAVVAVVGIGRITINDNPIKWFKRSHPIRVADAALNKHFAGTYMAYLALMPETAIESAPQALDGLTRRLAVEAGRLGAAGVAQVDGALAKLVEQARALSATATAKHEWLHALGEFATRQAEAADDDAFEAWEALSLLVAAELQRDEIFKDPQALAWVAALQDHLLDIRAADGRGLVGKSTSLADIVRTVYRELLGGAQEDYRIPDSRSGVAQTLMQYQNSHRPHDLWHFVERPDLGRHQPGFRKLSIWVQLKSGDNRDMKVVADAVDVYVAANPPPFDLAHRWFGLTYINVIWQEKMVSGMMNAFLGSFLVVLLMMILLFRSALWGLLCMVPLTVTIGLIYALIGFIGKDYDMPVAVLSSLSLGLAVDYAIHFLARSRALRGQHGDWRAAVGPMFGEPARAITRNVLVIGVGFLPLLAAPLVPYQTVGLFIASILITAGLATLLLLPALTRLLERWMFPASGAAAFTCRCGTCVFAGAVAVATIAVNVYQFVEVGINALTWISLAAILVLAAICRLMSRRRACAAPPEATP